MRISYIRLPLRSVAVRNPEIWAPLILVILGVLFFSDALFSSKNFYFRDILNFHYPLRKVLIDSYARWEWPLWNPYVYLGQPMLANPNYMAFYPTNLFHLFLPFNYAFKLHFIIHPLLAGPGLYFLLRRLGIRPIACLGGSVTYGFSGVVLSFLNLYNFVPSVALLPWIGYSFLGAVRKPGCGRILLFGLLLALQILAVDMFIGLSVVLVLAALAAIEMNSSEDWLRVAKTIARVCLLGAFLALGLSAVQILPTLELIPRSVRGSGYTFDSATQWSMHPLDLLNVLIPNLFGSPYTLTKSTYWGEPFHFGREGYLVSFFLGTGSLLLVLLSFFSARRRTRTVFLILGGTGVLLALGRYNPLWDLIFHYVPVFRLGRYPSKFSLVMVFSLSALVSLGLEMLMTALEERGKSLRILLVAGLIALLLGSVFLGFAAYCSWHPQFPQDMVAALLSPELARSKNMSVIAGQLAANVRWGGTFASLLGLILLATLYMKRSVLSAALVVFALNAELLSQNLRLVPLISETDVNFVSEVNRHLEELAEAKTFRVMSLEGVSTRLTYHLRAPIDSSAWNSIFFRRAGLPFYGIMDRIQYSLYIPVDGLSTSESHELFKRFMQIGSMQKQEMLLRTNSRFFLTLDCDVLPTAKLVTEYGTGADVTVKAYSLPDAMERAYFATGVHKAGSPDEALRTLLDPNFPVRDSVILEDPNVAGLDAQCESTEVRLLAYESQSVVCETSAPIPGYVVLLDSYYPGWISYIDGRAVPISRANYAFRAIGIPAGEHRIEFHYRPWPFYAGLGVTLVSLVVGISVLCLSRTSSAPVGRGN